MQQPPEPVLKESPDHLRIISFSDKALVNRFFQLRSGLFNDDIIMFIEHFAEIVKELFLDRSPVVFGPEELLLDVVLGETRDIEFLGHRQNGRDVELTLGPEGLLHEGVVELEHLVDRVVLVLLARHLVDQDLGRRVLVFVLLLAALVHHGHLDLPLSRRFGFFLVQDRHFLRGQTPG